MKTRWAAGQGDSDRVFRRIQAIRAEGLTADELAARLDAARAEAARLKASGATLREREEQYDDVRALRRLVEDARKGAAA